MIPHKTLATVLACLALAGCGSYRLASNDKPAPPSVNGQCDVSLTAPYDANTGYPNDQPPDYQVTLTNNGGSVVDVSQVGVVFYGPAGNEEGSDQQDANGIITSGQSLSWVYQVPPDMTASVFVRYLAKDGAAGPSSWQGDEIDQWKTSAYTCKVVEWS